jgi:FKBP-type peptidyl-prolyl cis-trans isomerase SlyD
MAGVDLFFTGHVEALRDAEQAELEHGHIHGPGGHQH